MKVLVKSAKDKFPELATLRQLCGDWQGGAWIYQPLHLKPEGTPRPIETIASLVDTATLADLEDQVKAGLGQILVRAYSGDAAAQRKFVRWVCGAVEALDRLARFRGGELKTIAEAFSTWPVLLSLNPQQIRHAKEALTQLGVGTKAHIPTHARQRVDPGNFWTQLATEALGVTRSNRDILAVLLAHVGKTRRKRTQRRFWGIKVEATIYTRTDGQIIIIPDWLKDVRHRLSEPITTANFAAWWKAVKMTALDYWKMYPREYEQALHQVGQREEKEWRRRSLALGRVKQALRSLIDLQ